MLFRSLSFILLTIQNLAENGDIRISEHGYDELSNDGLTAREIIDGLLEAVVVGVSELSERFMRTSSAKEPTWKPNSCSLGYSQRF